MMRHQLTRRTRRRYSLAACACVLAAALAAATNVGRISLLPPGFEPRPLTVAGATTIGRVDLPSSGIVDRGLDTPRVDGLGRRATLLARLATSEPVLARVARRVGIPADRLAGITPVVGNIQSAMLEPDFERRANDIFEAARPYRLNVQPHATLPTFNVYGQAPSVEEARRLADAAIPALRDELQARASASGRDPERQVRIEQLGRARGAVINGGAPAQIAVLTFLVVLLLCPALAFVIARVRRGWRLATEDGRVGGADHPGPSAHERPVVGAGGAGDHRPSSPGRLRPVLAVAGGGAIALPALELRGPAATTRRRLAEHALGDWPRTTRILPWMIAGFLVILWLVPFDTIELTANLPLDLRLDRLALPVIAGTYFLTLAAGGPVAPRIRFTWIHAGLVAFIAFACLSVVLNAHELNRLLEFDAAFKRLTLLAAYLAFFVMMASVVRRGEVGAFLNYTLLLGVICALGTIVEYRTNYNVFYSLSDAILPGFFQVGQASSAVVDEIGRRPVRGPAELGLEAVAMLTMALPIALVRVMEARTARRRLLFGLAACVILAGTIATFRKSAFLLPLTVIVTLAYFRRQQVVKLAPLAVLVIVIVKFLSPAALGGIVYQLNANRLGATTVSDRTLDYDALRPDLWSHLAFGRGFGTYNPTSYRILDMEYLGKLAEVGVLGTAAYVAMLLTVLAVARRPIRLRTPGVEPVALVAAAAAAVFLVGSALFDLMGFPHCPYILLSLAALLAVAAGASEPGSRRWSS